MRRLVLSNIVTDGQSQVLSQSAGASIDYSQGGSTGVLANGELIATLLSDAFLASNHQSSRVGASALYHGKGNDSASKSKADKTASIEHPTDYHRTSRVPSVRSHTSGNGILGIHSLATDKDVLIMVVAVNTNVKKLSANGSASYTPAASTKPMQQTEVAAPVVESMPAAGQAVGNPNNMPGSGHKPYMIYTYRISKVLENVNGCDVSIETLSNQCMHDEITPDLSVDLSLEVVQEIPLDYRPMCMALVDGHSFSAVINPSSCSSGTTSIESAASAPVLLIGGSDQHLHSYDLNVSTMHLTRTQDAHRDQLRDLWEELLFFAARRKGATTAGGMSNASLPASQRSVELKSLALPTAGFNSIISGATTGTQSTLTSALTIDVDFVSGSTGDVSDMGATVAAEQDISSNIESNTSGDGTNAGSSSQINNAETISRPLIDLPVDLLSEGSYINGEVGDNNGRKPDVLSSAGGISSNARESFSKSNSHFNQQTINRQVVSCFSSGVLVWMRIEESAKSLSETSSHPDHNAQGSLLSTSNDTSQYISADSIVVSSVGERCDSGVRIASKLSSVTSGTSLISPRKEETSIKSAILEDRVLDSDVDEEELVDQFDALAGCALSPSRNPEYWSSGSLGSGSKNSSNNALFEPGKIVPTSPYQHVADAESVAADVNASQLPPAPVIAPAVEVLNSFSQGIQPHIYSSDAAQRDGSGLMLSRGCLKLDYPITCIAGLRSRCRKVVNVRSIPRSTSYGSVRGAISSSTDAALGDLLGEKQSLLSSHVVVGLAQGGIAIVTLTPDPAAIGVPTNAAHGRPSSESNGTATGSNSKHSYKLTGAVLDATIGNKPSYLPAYAQYGSCTCVYACDVTGDGWDDIFLGFADGTSVVLVLCYSCFSFYCCDVAI